MQTDPEKLLIKHAQLVHADTVKVTSHVKREKGDGFLNALMIGGMAVPVKRDYQIP